MPDDDPADGSPAGLMEDARRRRLDLLLAHDALPPDPDPDQVDELVRLTEQVLEREDIAARARQDAERAVSDRIVYRNAVGLGLVAIVAAPAVAVAGLWDGGWTYVLLVAALVSATVVAGAHALGPPAGHRGRRTASLIVLLAGLVAAAVAPQWPPWWVRLLVLVVLVGTVLGFLATFVRTSAQEKG